MKFDSKELDGDRDVKKALLVLVKLALADWNVL